ncbi:MAG: DJ-1/PfpI family protein [Prochlorotrichaceae cyanobacterium]
MNIGIYIYDQAEVLDFSGPFEVFSTASRLSDLPNIFNVFLVSENGNMVTARGGYQVKPHYGFSTHPTIDLLIIVGGVHTDEMRKQRVLSWVKETSEKAQLVASVCTGVFILAEAGILSNQKVTTHWEDIPDLRNKYPELQVLENQRWVEAENIITSGGISSGIDMSLYLVSKLGGMALAEKTAKQMEFVWNLN